MGAVEKFYDRYWKDEHIKINVFDHHPGEWTVDNFQYHLEFFKPFVKGKLLDFGCGNGEFANMISNYCNLVCGVDCSEDAVNKAKSSYPKIEFKVLEDDNLPYEDNYFDTICMIDVFEHILDTETVLEELNRVLKPNGHLLIATSQITRLKMLIIALLSFDEYFYPASPHIRHFTKNNLADLLAKKGFKAVKYKKNRTYFGIVPQGQMVVASKIIR